MYLTHFGLTHYPFERSLQPDELFASAAAREAQARLQHLVELLDWAQETDEPLIFAPNYLLPDSASLVRFGNDALNVDDKHQFQPNGVEHRVLSAALELEPVFA